MEYGKQLARTLENFAGDDRVCRLAILNLQTERRKQREQYDELVNSILQWMIGKRFKIIAEGYYPSHAGKLLEVKSLSIYPSKYCTEPKVLARGLIVKKSGETGKIDAAVFIDSLEEDISDV